MPIEYEIDTEAGLVRVHCRGSFTIDQMIQHSQRVNRDPRFVAGMNTLTDLREAELVDEVQAIRRYVDHAAELEKLRGSCRWACLVADEAARDLIWSFNLVARSNGVSIETRAFLEEASALAWLMEPEDDDG